MRSSTISYYSIIYVLRLCTEPHPQGMEESVEEDVLVNDRIRAQQRDKGDLVSISAFLLPFLVSLTLFSTILKNWWSFGSSGKQNWREMKIFLKLKRHRNCHK